MPIPSPQERPDLYDDFDCMPPGGRETGIATPPRIQALIDARQKTTQPAAHQPSSKPNVPTA